MKTRTVGSDSVLADGVPGLSKREHFAVEAMKAIENSNLGMDGNDFMSITEVVNRAVVMADRLIERLNSDKDLEPIRK